MQVALGPVALVLSPSAWSFPIDLALGVIIPLHSHLGSNDVISDCVALGLDPPTSFFVLVIALPSHLTAAQHLPLTHRSNDRVSSRQTAKR